MVILKSNTKYLVPPKLQNKLLLAGITVPEMGFGFILALAGFFSANRLNAVLWAGIWLLLVARIFAGKSLFQIIRIMVCYHFIVPQQFVRSKKRNEKVKH